MLNTNGSTYFSSFELPIAVPATTARTMPTITYAIAVAQPKMLASRINEAKSTNGEEIKKENVTPNGNPALVKPMNSGIDEHEQNGVTVPSSAPRMLAVIPLNLPNIFFVRSGGKKL